jgi:hypothetical protein
VVGHRGLTPMRVVTSAGTQGVNHCTGTKKWNDSGPTGCIQRGNFFLVAESMLLVAYAAVLASHARSGSYILTASYIIVGFGLALTSVWTLISRRHMTYLRLIQQRVYSRIHEYSETRTAWRADSLRGWHLPTGSRRSSLSRVTSSSPGSAATGART